MRRATLLLLAAPLSAQGQVHEVFGQGAIAIEYAVSAAADGDVVLVHDGIDDYGFTIDGKSLTVVAAQGAVVNVRTRIAVRNLAAGQTVVLRGLHVYHDPVVGSTPGEIVLIEGCAGSVRLEDCTIEGFSNPLYGAPAVYADNAASVVLARCTLTDALQPIASIGHPGGAVVVTGGSHVTVLGGSLNGPEGSPGHCFSGSGTADGGRGGPAALVQGGFLLLSGTSLTGGAGGAPDDAGPSVCDCTTLAEGGHPGGGGPGLAVLGADSAAWNLDSLIASGAPGTSPSGCAPGPTAPPIVIEGGAYQTLSGSAFAFLASTPVSELGTLVLELAGPPSSPVVLAFGTSLGDLFFAPWKGSLLLAPSSSVLSLGSLSAAGTLVLPIPVGELPAGWESTVLHAQVAGVEAGEVVLGFASSVVILDQAF